MKHIYVSIAALFLLMSMVSCLNEVDDTGFEPAVPAISFDGDTVKVTRLGGDQTVVINSNLPWRIKSSAPWISFPVGNGLEGGEVVFNVQRNRGRQERSALLTAWITEESVDTLYVVQEPADVSESVTYHVKADGDGLASGISWEEATTLPTAIDAAADGDVILLAAGTYSPVALINGGETEEEKTFDIHSNFTMEGGYPADAVTGAVADPDNNETILSGIIGETQAYHVVVVSAQKSETHKVVLKNLTIRDGKGYEVNKVIYRNSGGVNFDAGEGAGMSIGASIVEMTNCIITANEGAYAGGCIIADGADVVFSQCVISDNTVTGNGGGVWNEGSVTMYDCTVANNKAGLACAGYYGVGGRSRIYNSSFTGNDNMKGGKLGGGAYLREGNSRGADAIFVNCTFAENKSASGGGLACYGTSAVGASVCLVSCTITDNEAAHGGGVWMNNATPTLKLHNCILSGNNTDLEYGGTVMATEAQVTKRISVVGSGLVGAEGEAISGWSFNAAAMLGTLDYWNGSLTRSCPLVSGADNPAVSNGMTAEQLGALAATLDGVEAEYVLKDQNGTERIVNSIGSVVSGN